MIEIQGDNTYVKSISVKINNKNSPSNSINLCYTTHDGGSATHIVTVLKSPTGNCQIQSIASFSFIFDLLEYTNCGRYNKVPSEYQKRIIECIFRALFEHKRCLIIDILEEVDIKLESIIKPDSIIFKTHYENTTGSKMVFYNIDLGKYI